MIIGIIVLVLLIGGGYFFYSSYYRSGKYHDAQFSKGPNFSTVATDVANSFIYSSEQDAAFYVKTDGVLYGKYFGLQTERPIINVKNGSLVSVAPDGSRGIVYYPQAAADIKDSENNFFLVDFQTNAMTSLGTDLSQFLWTPAGIFMLRGQTELLTYNFQFGYSKVSDFTFPVIALEKDPQKALFYLIASTDDTNSAFILSSFDSATAKFTKLLDTQATGMKISPTGKYLTLMLPENIGQIYDVSLVQKIADITNISPRVSTLSWSSDEKKLFYSSIQETYLPFAVIGPRDAIATGATNIGEKTGRYTNVMVFDVATKAETVVIDGTSKNVAELVSVTINGVGDTLYFFTPQTAAVYEVKVL